MAARRGRAGERCSLSSSLWSVGARPGVPPRRRREAHHRTFNSIPQPLPPGPPGSLIRQERLLGAPDGAIAWRVLYRSTDVHGATIGVSGIVVAPTWPAPKDGWPIVSWAHPTTGAYGDCAPSVGVEPFLLIEGLHELLDGGYAIAATDYPGMGADGPPSSNAAHGSVVVGSTARDLPTSGSAMAWSSLVWVSRHNGVIFGTTAWPSVVRTVDSCTLGSSAP